MEEFDPYAKNDTGTTLVAIKYNGGCLLASDCLVTRGTVISDRGHKKIYEISPSEQKFGSIKVLGCGNSAHIQMVTRMVFNYLNMHAMEMGDVHELKLETVVRLFSTICYNNKNFISAAFIVSNGREIYTLTAGGAYIKNDLFSSKGSGSGFIEGFLKDRLMPNMNFYETREAAVKALALAILSDGSSGGNMRLVDVKSNGVSSEEILLNSEVKRVIRS